MTPGTQEPLVSITVITYNSSRYVLETLESVKAQTYPHLELIISDDCSTDDTVDICREWLAKNSERFVESQIVTSPVNTGITGNKNRANARCKGQWLKSIAGDDMFLPNCVEDNMAYVRANPGCRIAVSNFNICDSGGQFVRRQSFSNLPIFEEPVSAEFQKKWMMLEYAGFSPTLFISQEVYKNIKYDERLNNLEDAPFALNVLNSGYVFSYFDRETVMYRAHNQSVRKSATRIFSNFYEVYRKYEKLYLFPEISWFEKLLLNIEYLRKKGIDRLGLNKNNFICRGIHTATRRLSPINIYRKYRFRRMSRTHQKRKNALRIKESPDY